MLVSLPSLVHFASSSGSRANLSPKNAAHRRFACTKGTAVAVTQAVRVVPVFLRGLMLDGCTNIYAGEKKVLIESAPAV